MKQDAARHGEAGALAKDAASPRAAEEKAAREQIAAAFIRQ